MPLGDSAREVKDLDFLGVHLPSGVVQGVSTHHGSLMNVN